MGHHDPLSVIEDLARRGLFRECELKRRGVDVDWLRIARMLRGVQKHAPGIWGQAHYKPTRYELFQLRFSKAVFWGPSALWLLGASNTEPEALWIAIANKSRKPRRLDLSTVIIRPRNLEEGVVTLKPAGRLVALRAHCVERALGDVARHNTRRMLDRAEGRTEFSLTEGAYFLSEASSP